MKDVVRLGYIGLGWRGYGLLNDCYSEMADVEICAICDANLQKVEKGAAMLVDKGRPMPKKFTDHKKMLEETELDAVVITTGWNGRIKIALDCMEAGKYTAIEVGCAYDISECYALVDVYERTGAPLMMLENACYEQRALTGLMMAREGLFGEIVFCSGGYHHYLNELDLFKKNRDGTFDLDHYRLTEYAYRNCDQYPTHELGPLSKILNINRGNRLLSLTSFATRSCGLASYAKDHVSEDHPFRNTRFAQGDIITTIINCARGEQIILTLDTTLPRGTHTSRYAIRGTKGMMEETSRNVCTYYLDGMPEETFDNEAEFLKKHEHPLAKEWWSMDEQPGGHGGCDWLTNRAFIESVKRGIEPPIDVYDSVLWASIASLSEASISCGSVAVSIPDFTKGKWFRREPAVPFKYSLDVVVEDPETPIVPV